MVECDMEEDDFQPRDYQLKLMDIALRENTIIYLPTGTGKTLIAVMILKQLSAPLQKSLSQGGKISIMLVNTIALVDQQMKFLRGFTHFEVGAYSGEMNVDTWDEAMWRRQFEKHQVLVMTAQILVNIVEASILSLNDVNLIIFDECHRAVNDHAMRQVMMFFKGLSEPPRVVGLTATLLNKNCTPPLVMDEVKALETTFHSKVATVDDLRHVIGYSTNPKECLNNFTSYEARSIDLYAIERLEALISMLQKIKIDIKPLSPLKGHMKLLEPDKGLKDLQNLVKDTVVHLKSLGTYGGKLAVIAHTIQLERIKKHCQDSKLQTILEAINTTFIIVKKMLDDEMGNYNKKEQIYKFSSPQVVALLDVIREYKRESEEALCGIVFVERRFTAKVLYNIILRMKEADTEFEEVHTNFVVGYNNNPYNDTREGLYNTKMNRKVINQFRNKEINLLIASNVLEEGVDIPTCTLVVNFDKPNNYRAYIQSKGRARHRSSFYYMMVDLAESDAFYKKYETYKQVENILNLFLVGQNEIRVAPSKTQIEKLYDEHELPPYYTNGPGSAQVTLVSAISLLCRYCTCLPSDKYTSYVPNWYLEEVNGEKEKVLYRVIIELPTVCPILEPIQGEYMLTKKAAKRAAALKTCELLHKSGALDDKLLPIRHDVVEEDVSYFFKHWAEVNEKDAGNTKKRRIHGKQVPKIMRGPVLPNKLIHLHVIEIKPLFTPDTVSDRMIHQLYSSQLCFGVLSSHALPEICQFSVFVSAGEISVNFRVNHKTLILTPEQTAQLRCFHCLIFKDLLKVLKTFLVFDNNENAEGFLIIPIQNDNSSYQIDFDVVINNKELVDQKAEPNDQDKLKLVVSEDNYLGKIVTPWYRSDDKQYLVTSICTSLNALSEFPSEDFVSYSSYFNEKYHTTVLNPTQPLLLVKGLSKRLNCLKPRHSGPKRSREKTYEEMEEHLIPELCVKQDFPADLWIQAALLPSILHRITSLLQAEELRKTIAVETGLSIADLPQGAKWLPLVLDNHVVNNKIEEPSKSKAQKMAVDEPDETAIITLPKTAINQLIQDFNSIKLEAQFPWQEKEEPVDIERQLDVTLMDIQYYENFISQKVSVDQRMKKNELTNRNDFPAITYDKDFIKRDIDLLKTRTNDQGPELKEIFRTLTTAKCNDIVNFERLETLGDSFLKLTISLFIILNYPKYNEGRATAFKGRLISNKNLYYIGAAKKLAGYLRISDFAPMYEWKPLSFGVPKQLQETINTKQLSASSLFSFSFSVEEQISGVLEAQSEQRIAGYNEQSEEEKDESAYDSMYTFLELQTVPDKSIADSVEALLGVYFEACGFIGGLTLLEWLEIIPQSKNIKNLLHMVPPNPILNENATIENINFHIPSWHTIEDILGYKFNNRAYLLQALTHSSYTPNRITNCYQRLEFLGDAILDFLITCHIYETCGNLNPGQLTDLRSALVNNITFAGFTVRCGFHKFLLFSNNKLLEYIDNFVQYQESKDFAINGEVLILLEENDLYMAEHVDVPKVLGDIFEALAGAIYLDSGMDLQVVWNIFYRIMWKEIEIFRNNVPKNAIRLLYETVGAHPEFQKSVQIDSGGTMVGLDFMLNGAKKRVYGFGENKALAKKAAAKIALCLLHN